METLNSLEISHKPLHKKSITRKDKVMPTLMVVCAVLISCWAITGRSGNVMTASEVPAFKSTEHLQPLSKYAERLVYVSHYLNRMVGTVSESESQFSNIPDTWYRYLQVDAKNMNPAIAETAGMVLAMMRAYQEMKTKRSMNDGAATMFWARISTLMDMKDWGAIYSEGKDTPRVSGKQLEFWTKA